MLDWLEIRNFAITDSINLSYQVGFTTVTGETGSGKSLIVDALTLLLGARADNSWIRHNAEQAEIQGSFALPATHPGLAWLHHHQLDQENECLLRRVIRRDKPSRGYINGHAVTAVQLRDLGAQLVDIHGQHEHHSLMAKATQQQLLDAAAANQAELSELAQHYEQRVRLQKQLEQITAHRNQTRERTEWLNFQLNELDAFQPSADEWQHLAKQQKRLSHLQDLVVGSRTVMDKLHHADNNIIDNLNACITQLNQLGKLDAELVPSATMLEEAAVILSEAAQTLSALYQDADIEPQEIQRVEQRFGLYHDLARKHRVAAEELPRVQQSLQQELDGLRDPEAEIARLQQLQQQAVDAYQAVAARISERRAECATQLAAQVTAGMQELGMRGGHFSIELQPLADGKISRSGLETISFLVSANPGQPALPLNRVASGGELSRISLALQVILASSAPAATLVFDEVDIGIGGAVADIVGQKLKQLGQSRQIICVTHLAQVAAKGDDHLQVSKDKDVAVTVTRLNQTQRIEEIARMSGGEKLTPQSLAHAQQMLGAA